ncbi:MAG: primosomal replication protein N [Betaproteobacteria bacterium]|nr:primosomal replication protein N [Betaproteobacteria bacterium]
MKRNQVVIDGRLLKRATLRHTPAGIPVIDLVIEHKSMQTEAGGQREARCEVEAVAIGELAVRLSTQKTNQPLRIKGFLTQHSVKDRRLVLHVTDAISNGTE